MKDLSHLSPQQRWQQRKRETGCCIDCGKPREEGSYCRCNRCRAKNLKSSKRCQKRKISEAKRAAKVSKTAQRDGHLISAECWCLPRVEVRDGVKIWVHEGGLEHGC